MSEYLQVNMSDSDFIEKLKNSIKHKLPLSFSRFGDGEIFFINNNLPKIVIDLLINTYGYSDIEVAKKDVLNTINIALASTDIIGIMNKNNTISKNISYTQETWSIKHDYVKSLRQNKEILVVDHMITRGVDLGDINNFKNIINGNNIAIVTPRCELLKKTEIHKILDVDINYIDIPMGMNLNERDDIFCKLDDINELIVLYGCSLTGKDFGAYLSNKGKISLDFGATLDAWSGLITRNWFNKNGIQSHCLINK